MRKSSEITNTMDLIDSRDIIARVEELEELREERIEELKRFIEDPDDCGKVFDKECRSPRFQGGQMLGL